MSVTKSESYDLWHRRLGDSLNQPLVHLPNIAIDSSSSQTLCDVCCCAKHTQAMFPSNNSCTKDKFDLIHCDSWRPCWCSTLSSAKYFLTIVDDFSHAVWVYLMHDKSQTRGLLRTFCLSLKPI